ncbi:alkylated DNA repair protein alkB 1 [Exophiala viscosa]|uniref:alkylated DNA repair protein alkB 1 n=1 Tax=Exophiala viscosa TaxID=2486360 RepID=UPI00218F2519|nr:alkylated DNA repair protein alkB 1 [Exophiala viscosa]
MVHDAHARPPDALRELFKQRRKQCLASIDAEHGIIDPQRPGADSTSLLSPPTQFQHGEIKCLERIYANDVLGYDLSLAPVVEAPNDGFEVNALPGLYVLPSLLSPRMQIALLEKLLHRDLNNPAHKTNLHLHYDISYPVSQDGREKHEEVAADCSFFGVDTTSLLTPKDPAIHKPITIAQMLESKLRWTTLGGQYDWTNKVYPDEVPPAFPPDIAALLKDLFPKVDAQAAILNFYSPGDTLSVHKDVSEECQRDLISISIGCDAVFIVGNEDGSETATVRLRSGDAVVMSGESRFAWHAVPKILSDTCPVWLQDWPNIPHGSKYQVWQGWMRNKRINLNVRQMQESYPSAQNP